MSFKALMEISGTTGVPMDILASAAEIAGEAMAAAGALIYATEEKMNTGPYYMGHSRKRFIKLAMSFGLQRNEATLLANQCRYMVGIDDIPTMISILDERTRLPKDIVPFWMPVKKERRHWERLAAR